jgi:hypothetical protein
MARVPITVMGYRCDRCDHEWIPRGGDLDAEPKVCPKCKSPYWNQPRKNARPMTYEEFRDRVRTVLTDAGRGLTWTEVRTLGKFPQAFPNNQWVRRLEGDIHLDRVRSQHGILHWQLGSEGSANGATSGTSATIRTPARARKQQGSLERGADA